MARLSLKKITLYLALMTIMIVLAESQKSSKKTFKDNVIDVEEKVKLPLPYRDFLNSSLPFNTRFGPRPRISKKFHYPALPADYWAKHKKPSVTPWDESLYLDA